MGGNTSLQKGMLACKNVLKVNGSNLVTYLDRSLIFETYVVKSGSKNSH
jgi:hypothetical protein